jgi:DNA-directed RNA polymerase subunit RPC12/RpoP
MSKKPSDEHQQKVFEACPHCGHQLSPWERVLLGVDRALTCKHCWYRILYDVIQQDHKPPKDDQTKAKG